MEHVSEICCQTLCPSVRTNDWGETLNREIHPQKRNHRRSVDVVSSRPKTMGVLRPKPGVCRGRDPKTQRQQRAPRQGLKLLCSRLCKGICQNEKRHLHIEGASRDITQRLSPQSQHRLSPDGQRRTSGCARQTSHPQALQEKPTQARLHRCPPQPRPKAHDR